jgi:hypothetical protein
MIKMCIQPLLDPALDHTEITDHSLRVKTAIQYQLHRPGFAHQTALGMKVGKIHMGQIIDEELHGGLATSLGALF